MPFASGIQVTFLILALEFVSMLAARALLPLLEWPAHQLELLGQLITFSLAAMILFGVPGLRRYCMAELRVPIPEGSLPGLLAATMAKVTVPFAMVGGLVYWAFATGISYQLPALIPTMDPVRAWEWTLSPPGLLRLFLLSWLAGPVIEEIVFRGLLYRAFERQWGWLASMVATSLLFGLAHPSRIVAASLGSVILICVLRRTGSLRACIVVHSAFNMLISWPLLGQLLLTAPSGDPARLSTWAPHLACLALASIAIPVGVWVSRRELVAAGDRES